MVRQSYNSRVDEPISLLYKISYAKSMASQISYLSQSFASRLWLQVYGIPAEALKTTTLVLVLPIQPSRPPPSISTTAPFRSSDEPIELC